MTTIHKIEKLINRLKELDEVIIKIDKAALKVINDKDGLELRVNLEVCTNKEEENQEYKSPFDEDHPLSGMMMFSYLRRSENPVKDTISLRPSSKTALRMMQVYVNDLNWEREGIIIELKNLGVQI